MTTIHTAAKKHSKASLVHLIDELYGIYGDIDEIIEVHLFGEDEDLDSSEYPENASNNTLAQSVQRQIQQLANEEQFIDYRESQHFSYRLQSLLIDIDTDVREQSPQQALDLAEAFLAITDNLMERVDDSNGDIGAVIRDTIDLWLDIAAEVRDIDPEYRDWTEKALWFFDNNDYGCFDNILSHSRRLLTQEELQQLAWRFENEAKKAIKNQPASEKKQGAYNFEAAHACIGIRSIAEATDDMSLFEKATLITSPSPNTMQMESIIQFAFELMELERAEYWLSQPQWQEDKSQYQLLNNELLQLQGNIKQLKQNLLNNFLENSNDYSLESYWGMANTKEKQTLKPKVEKLAKKAPNIADAVNMLITIENLSLSAELIIKREQEIEGQSYTTILPWVNALESTPYILATILCYRHLLTDLLNRGYAKAYHHGARYFHRLIELDNQNVDYQHFGDAQTFIQKIQEKHWRKRSFWAEADYPNKP